jgi:Na+-transporting NADH:ubiquinone oxidoreductase subunit NqrC
MAQQENLSQQSNPPVQQENKNRTLLSILVSILATAILVGGGVFFWQQNSYKKQALDLEKQFEEIASEAAAEKEEMEKKTCKGVWKNGVCVKLTCVDSDVNEKPDDIYIKGNVAYTDENGVETVVYDECTGSKTQVNEMWCYESPAGSENYVQGKMVYDCDKGCLDGACIK